MPRPPSVRCAAVLAVGMGALGACGTSASTATATTAGSPEAIRAPMSTVLAGLPKIVVLGNKAASDVQIGAYDDANEASGAIEHAWMAVEGTVKADDAATYARIESAQGLIQDGAKHHDGARTLQGANAQADAVGAFIATHGQSG